MFGYALFLLNACSVNSGPIYFESGSYVVDLEYYAIENDSTESEETTEEDSNTDSDYSAEMETLVLDIDLDNLTATISGTSYDTTLTLKERSKDDWNDMCPMQLSTTEVQTVDIVGDLELWGETHQETYVQASDCGGEERTTNTIILGSNNSEILYLIKN